MTKINNVPAVPLKLPAWPTHVRGLPCCLVGKSSVVASSGCRRRLRAQHLSRLVLPVLPLSIPFPRPLLHPRDIVPSPQPTHLSTVVSPAQAFFFAGPLVAVPVLTGCFAQTEPTPPVGVPGEDEVPQVAEAGKPGAGGTIVASAIRSCSAWASMPLSFARWPFSVPKRGVCSSTGSGGSSLRVSLFRAMLLRWSRIGEMKYKISRLRPVMSKDVGVQIQIRSLKLVCHNHS